MAMSPNLLHHLSDRNPQFLREVKGCLKFRNVMLTAALSLLGQCFIWLYFQRLIQGVFVNFRVSEMLSPYVPNDSDLEY